MKIDFYLRFQTKVGQSLYLMGNLGVLGNNNADNALAMAFLSEEYWHVSIEVDELFSDSINYRYVFKNDNGDLLIDGEKQRNITAKRKDIVVIDSWNNAGEYANIFYTAPFQDVFFKNHKNLKSKTNNFYTHSFKIKERMDNFCSITSLGLFFEIC